MTQEQNFIEAEKRVNNIKGFYTHLAATPFLIPFIIFINLKTVPQVEWFWFFIAAWSLGLVIHWVGVFKLSKLSVKKEWEQKKIKEMMGEESTMSFDELESENIQELFYIRTKKKIKEIKGFYIYLIVTIITIPLIIFVNLKFVPEFHFFWFVVIGMLFPLFVMWLGTFGFSKLGLGSNWEQKKIKKIMHENSKRK